MPTHCGREFNGPEYSFIDPDDATLTRKTLCDNRDCDYVLLEEYEVKRLVNVDADEEVSPHTGDGTHILEAIQGDLRACDDQSRVLTDIDTAELAHNALHEQTFSVLYEYSERDAAFLLYFEQTRISQTQSAPKTL